MLTSHIHPRLGLPKFLSFEPYFKDALLAFDSGNDTLITITGGLSPNTVAARMRDSLSGLRLNGKGPNADRWRSAIDPVVWDLFWRHDGHFVIAGPDSAMQIWFRSKRPKGGHSASAPIHFNEVQGDLSKHLRTKTIINSDSFRPSASAEVLRANDCTEATIRKMVDLRTTNIISQAIAFPGTLDPGLITELTDSFDIAFHHDVIRNETILL
jgi:hypothetical protein